MTCPTGRGALAGAAFFLLFCLPPAAAQSPGGAPITNVATATWTDANGNVYDAATGSATIDTVLPVELAAFEAVADGEGVVLRWRTLSETNNAGFEIQRRDAATEGQATGTWASLAFVAGAGTTAEPQHYEHRVQDPEPGTHTFRLRQVDFDGTFAYSPEVEVVVALVEAYRLTAAYPNPFNPEARFTLAVREAQHVRVAVFDLLGRQVALLHDGVLAAGAAHRFVVDGARLASGAYVIRATGERFAATQRVTLVR